MNALMAVVLLSGIGDFFSSIMKPLHAAMSFVLMWAYKGLSVLVGADRGLTWALAIMTLTVVVRTILIPLFIKQINSARNMQLMQPKLKEIQEKFASDRERQGIETQKLMKEEGVNPMASCFPLLLQMPIFIALYQVLYAAANGRALGYFFEQNLDMVASLTDAQILGARLAGHFWLSEWNLFGATQIFAMILIVLMTGLFFVTQKQLMGKNMTPEAMTGPMAQQQKMMLYMFPVMYLMMGLWIPVGVLLYWVTNNVWTLGQQWLLIRNNPTPGTPAYIDWEERMIKHGKDPEQIASDRRAKRSKSPSQTKSSRPVGGIQPSQDTGETPSDPSSPSTGIARQQIQRQQPTRQSRTTRSNPKKK
jgi:YidC/Oxa1 family membrane protein insertase